MGIIHQKLYQKQNLASIEMKDYFKNLSESILDTYGAWEKVDVSIDMPTIELDVDTAIPIGLIVNELLTNALKHAFPNGNTGKVNLSLIKQNKDTLTLVVTDNGIGKTIPKTSNGTGFGTQLISLLTKQLNGTIKEVVQYGTSFIFEFKKIRYAG